MTACPELLAAGVAFGHDAMDPWYPMGSGDMLEVAAMGLHVAQMTSQAQMRACFDAVTVNPARILAFAHPRPRTGVPADFVLLQAGDRSRRSACARAWRSCAPGASSRARHPRPPRWTCQAAGGGGLAPRALRRRSTSAPWSGRPAASRRRAREAPATRDPEPP